MPDVFAGLLDLPPLESPGAITYARGAIISAGVAAGASSNQIISALSQAGIGVRRQDALRAIAELRQTYTSGQGAASIPFGHDVTTAMFGEPPSNWTGGYVYQAQVTYRLRNEDSSYSLFHTTKAIRSREALSPEDIASGVMGIVSTPIEEGGTPDVPDVSDLLTITTTGAWWDTQGRSIPVFGGGG